MNAPILLSSEIASLATGDTLELPTQPMQNPFREPMWVDEIRFQIARTSLDGIAWYAKIRAEVFLGRQPLTNGFVPIGNLSVLTLGGDVHYYTYQWKLPRPMYVPGTELVRIRLRNSAILGDSTSKRVRAAIVGRSIRSGKDPVTVDLPWAAVWEPGTAGTGIAYGSAETFYNSAEHDLGNPFDYDLAVQRFVGRGAQDEAFNQNNGDFAASAIDKIEVQAADSFGRIMVRDPTPFTSLFFYGDKAWTVNAKLQPKGFYLFSVISDLSSLTPGSNQWLGISMIGHRQVKLIGGL